MTLLPYKKLPFDSVEIDVENISIDGIRFVGWFLLSFLFLPYSADSTCHCFITTPITQILPNLERGFGVQYLQYISQEHKAFS